MKLLQEEKHKKGFSSGNFFWCIIYTLKKRSFSMARCHCPRWEGLHSSTRHVCICIVIATNLS